MKKLQIGGRLNPFFFRVVFQAEKTTASLSSLAVLIPSFSGWCFKLMYAINLPAADCLNPFFFRVVFQADNPRGFVVACYGLNPFFFRVVFQAGAD